MSVLSCNRTGCKNVMCDRLSHKYGYICDECFAQLVRSDLSIKEFMNTDKDEYTENLPDPDKRRKLMEELFPIR